jgi:hypothetical protein
MTEQDIQRRIDAALHEERGRIALGVMDALRDVPLLAGDGDYGRGFAAGLMHSSFIVVAPITAKWLANKQPKEIAR